MKLFWVPLLLGVSLWGDEAADRAQIASVIAALNQTPLNQAPELARLFTADSDGASALAEISRLTPVVTISHEPWGEATWGFAGARLRITNLAIRFITPEVALADGTASRPDGKDSTSLLFVMKKEGDGWKIASIRLLAPATIRSTTH
jgi:hypothetical protein